MRLIISCIVNVCEGNGPLACTVEAFVISYGQQITLNPKNTTLKLTLKPECLCESKHPGEIPE